jgi:hypothetical protein
MDEKRTEKLTFKIVNFRSTRLSNIKVYQSHNGLTFTNTGPCSYLASNTKPSLSKNSQIKFAKRIQDNKLNELMRFTVWGNG